MPTIYDEDYIRVSYVRYADDFIVGVRGPKHITKEVLESIKNFLKTTLHLSVNEEKTHITHIYSNKAKFLGMLISCPPSSEIRFTRSAHTERFRRLALRVSMKMKIAEQRKDKENVKEFISLLKNKLKSKDQNFNVDSVAALVEQMGIRDELSKLNSRNVIKRLALELAQLKVAKTEDQELHEMISKLKTWSEKDPNLVIDSNKEIPLRHLTKKQVLERIREKFQDVLKLTKSLPQKSNIPKGIKFPDDFTLNEYQITEILKLNTSFKRYEGVLKILIESQDKFNEETLVENTRLIKFNETQNNIGVLYGLPPQINADLGKIRRKLVAGGIILENKSYGVKKGISNASDADIVRYFSRIAHGFLSYYRCADNLTSVKRIIMYTIRFSLLSTLMFKNKMTKGQALAKYGDPISCVDFNDKVVGFPSNMEVNNLKKQFLIGINSDPFSNIEKIIIRMSNMAINAERCAVKDCDNSDIEVHHIRQLFRKPDSEGNFTVITAGKAKRLTGQLAIESALKRKQIPLCKMHHIQ